MAITTPPSSRGGTMKARIPWATSRAVVLGVATLALTVGGATAALNLVADEGVISACRHRSGFLLVPSPGKACKQSEQALAWNARGPAGPAGEIDSVEALDGIACATSDGEQGAVSVETEVDGAIVLTCERADGPPPPPAASQ